MHYTTLALATFSTAVAAAGGGQAGIINNCNFDVYLWSVGDGATTERGIFATGKTWNEDLGKGTREIKISQDEDALENGSSHTSLVWAASGDSVTYDAYHIFGSPLQSLTVETDGDSDDGSCGDIIWNGGEREGRQIGMSCKGGASITMTLCAKEDEE